MSYSDNSLFIHHTPNSITVLLVYVDDILLTGSNIQFIKQLLVDLNSRFAMRLLGPLSQFLGVDISYNSDGMVLSQQSYILKLLKKVGLIDCKPSPTPIATKKCLSIENCMYSDPQYYRSLVCALQYVTITRPNLTFVVNSACQHMHNPQMPHLVALKRILRYLARTSNLGLHYTSGPLTLQAYSNAD